MPITAIDLVKKLMAKAGVTHDGELTADIPDEIAEKLDNGLLTIAAATNNHPEIRKVYTAQAYNGVDNELKKIMIKMDFPDDVIREITQAGISDERPNGSTTKRVYALVKKIKELSDKAAPADKEAAQKLSSQITELNQKLAAEIKKQTDLKTDFEGQLKQVKIKQKLDVLTGSAKTMYDDLPAEAKEAAINALVTKALNDSEADFTFDDKGNLSLIKKDGSNLFGDNHTLVTPQSFIDKTLSKILKVTDSTKSNTTTATAVTGAQQNQANPSLKAALNESLQDYENATKAVAV